MREESVDLRTRHKLATREAISAAALRLAVERGPGNVRVDDIAAAAGVSPRTYHNYFSSREEAICAISSERAQRIGDALHARPVAEPLAEAIINALVEEYGTAEPDRTGMALIASEPTLRGEFLKGIITIEEPLAQAIVDRLGASTDYGLAARVLAASAVTAVRIAMEHWLESGADVTFVTVLREALTLLAPTAQAIEREAA